MIFVNGPLSEIGPITPPSQRLRASFTDYSRELMAQPPQAASTSADAREPVSSQPPWVPPFSALHEQARQASPEPMLLQAPVP
jgi:hypothetical protein